VIKYIPKEYAFPKLIHSHPAWSSGAVQLGQKILACGRESPGLNLYEGAIED